MDPVSLTLAIVPLCVLAVQGYRRLSSTLSTFRRYHKEIERLLLSLEVQQSLFESELKHLFEKTLGRQIVADIIEKCSHSESQTDDNERKLRSNWGSSYDTIRKVIIQVQNSIQDFEVKLSVFAPETTEGSRSNLTRDALRISFKKKEYDKSLNALRKLNKDLKTLRKIIMGKEDNYTKIGHYQLPPAQYKIVRNMSSLLHTLLLTRSSCNSGTGSHHSVKLLLSSTDDIYPRMNFFFEHKLTKCEFLPIYALFQGSDYNNISLLNSPSENSSNPHQRHGFHEAHNQNSTNTRSNMLDTSRFEDHGEDLMKTGVKCEKLKSYSVISTDSSSSRSLGYLEVRGNQKLVLYPGTQGLEVDYDYFKAQNTTPLCEFLKIPVDEIVTKLDRVKIGIILVKSMLKYNSTPWWPRDWILKEVCVIHKDSDDLSSYLNTLHFSMELKNICSAIGVNKGPVLSGQEDCRFEFLSLNDLRSAMNEYGIRNLTLYLLGVALLQIGLWKEVAWENHEEVCSEVDNLSLGKAYNDGVKKLIYCDFGLAKADLNDPELQSAIFYGLVRDLEHSAGVASAGLCDVSSLETLRS